MQLFRHFLNRLVWSHPYSTAYMKMWWLSEMVSHNVDILYCEMNCLILWLPSNFHAWIRRMKNFVKLQKYKFWIKFENSIPKTTFFGQNRQKCPWKLQNLESMGKNLLKWPKVMFEKVWDRELYPFWLTELSDAFSSQIATISIKTCIFLMN